MSKIALYTFKRSWWSNAITELDSNPQSVTTQWRSYIRWYSECENAKFYAVQDNILHQLDVIGPLADKLEQIKVEEGINLVVGGSNTWIPMESAVKVTPITVLEERLADDSLA